MTPDAPALVTRRRTPMGLTRAVVKVLVLVVACALNVSRARMLQGSTGDDAWGGSARDDDGISLLCEHQCAQLNRTTVGCSSSHNATCGKCFPKYVGSDKPWTACSAGSDDYHDYYGGSDDYGPGHDSGPMGLQASLATGLSSLLVALMCLVTWRGWLDCCSKKRRLKSHRAFMEPSTTLWRCDVCFHSNSVLNRYCVLCQTEATEQTITIAVTRAQVDHTDDDVFYTRLESPRARVSTIRCSHISPAHATLTPEQTVAVSRLRWRRHMSKKSFRWIECDPEDVKKESKLQGTMVTAIMVSVLPSPSRIRPYVCCEVSSGIEWLPAGEVSFDAKMYRMWRGIQRVSMLNFDERLRWLQQQLLRLREPISNEKHTIHVHRHHILKQTIDIFLLTPCSTLRRPLRVDIIDEPGIDGGGILREWLQLLCTELFSESSEYFVRTSSTQSDGYWIRPSSTRRTDCDLQHYVFFGKILGKVLLEGLVMNFRLCIPMLKHLLGYPLSMEDIQYVDEQIYTSVLFIHDYGQVEDLSLNFAVANHELIPNGSNIAVTESNKASYLELVIKYYLIDSVEHEMRCIIEGLRSIIPDKILHVFDFKELDLVLSGQPHIDVIDWQTHSAVGMLLHHPEKERMVIEWFWEIVKSLDQRGRSRLVQYVTGSAGLPVEGFSCLTSLDGNLQPFTIQLIETTPDTAMPYASTCFNRLDLPVYQTKEEMEEVLTMILSTDVTGFNRR